MLIGLQGNRPEEEIHLASDYLRGFRYNLCPVAVHSVSYLQL